MHIKNKTQKFNPKMYEIQKFNPKECKKTDRLYTTLDGNEILLPSITEICAEVTRTDFVTQQMLDGSAVHDAIAQVHLYPNEYSNIRDSLTAIQVNKFDRIMTNLRQFARLYKCTPKFVEKSMYVEFKNGRGYKGTADLIMVDEKDKNIVVEFKTGSKASWHSEQLAANMVLQNAFLGVLVYEDIWIDQYLYINHFNQDEPTYFDKFLNKLNAYFEGNLKNGKILQDTKDIDLDTLAGLLKQEISLKKQIEEEKQKILESVKDGYSFENQNLLVSWRKPTTRKNLKKEVLDLVKSDPANLEEVEVAGSFIFKLKNQEVEND